MREYRVKHVDAFTGDRFAGNPAGVVVDARGLNDAAMQHIAREMNLSETAFVLPPTNRNADIQIRWFTPATEVPLCGHATIAGFHALAEDGLQGMRKPGTYHFRLQTKSGILSVVVEKGVSGTLVEFQLPIPTFHIHQKVPDALLKSLGIAVSAVQADLPFVSESYLYLPIRKLSTVKSMKPDFVRLSAVSKATRTLGLSVFTLETLEDSSAVHSRFFAPAVGIAEDPVTGSASGPLGVYLYQYAMRKDFPIPSFLLPDGRVEFIAEQGDDIGRRGRVKIRLRVTGHGIRQVCIAGEAVTIMNSQCRI